MQAGINFEQLATNAKAAAKQLLQRLARTSLSVVDVSSDGKTTRVGDTSFRKVALTFTDNQTVELSVKPSGDVFRVTVNGKAVPVTAQGGVDEAVKELVGILDKSRAAHQKRLAAMAMKPPEGATTAVPAMKVALETQVQAVETAVAEAEKELEELRAT